MSEALQIEIARPPEVPADPRLPEAVRRVLAEADIRTAEISLAVVGDAAMHELNRRYLAHDYPTDVLSFVLEFDADARRLEGEIIVSYEYAAREAPRYGWSGADELLLYVIHGALHLVGYDDLDPDSRAVMRAAEARHLAHFGLQASR